MEWNLSKVPRTLHLYWSEDKLSYMRYLTVKSFTQLNPDWRVIVWIPSVPSIKRTWETDHQNYEEVCDDYRSKLSELPIRINSVPFDEINATKDMSEIHRSDFLRLYLLYHWGGVWSDMDIIYFKPITYLAVNNVANKDKDTFVCMRDHSAYIHSGGFLMSGIGSAYFGALLKKVKDEYNPLIYQCIGVDMYNKYFPTFDKIEAISPAVNIEMDAVYAHDALHVKEILGNGTPMFTDKSIGIHWYAGNPLWANFIKDTNGGLENIPDSIIGNVIKPYKP